MIDKTSKKNNDIFLLEALRMLRNPENKIARKAIYETYIDYKKSHIFDIFKEPIIRKYSDLLKADFDEIGFLVEFGYINKKHFLALYSDVIRRVWIALEEEIIQERKLRKNIPIENNQTIDDEFMIFFERLAGYARKFREQKKLPEPIFVDFRN